MIRRTGTDSGTYNKHESGTQGKWRVSFADVEVREYDLDISDNPACAFGPAIGLGWTYQVLSKENINDFEKSRGERRPFKALKLSRKIREGIMKKSSFTRKEIAAATASKVKARSRRSLTVQNLKYARYEEKLESVKRKAKQILLRKEKDADLLKIWPEYADRMDRLKKEYSTSSRTLSFTTIDSFKSLDYD